MYLVNTKLSFLSKDEQVGKALWNLSSPALEQLCDLGRVTNISVHLFTQPLNRDKEPFCTTQRGVHTALF